MILNELNANLPSALVQQLISMIRQIVDSLPFMISLTGDERQKLTTVSDGRLPYVRKLVEYCTNHREKIGMSVENLAELQRYAQLFEDLTLLLRLVTDLRVGLRDTQMQAGAILFRLSRIGHGQIKLAYLQGKPGVEAALDDLDKLYDGQGNFGSPDDGGDDDLLGPIDPKGPQAPPVV